MVKVALVGCGRISKRHIEAIGSTDGIEISLVCDNDEERAKKTAEQLGCSYITDYNKIILPKIKEYIATNKAKATKSLYRNMQFTFVDLPGVITLN